MKLRLSLSIIIFTFIFPVIVHAQSLITAVKSGDIAEVEALLPYENMEEKDEDNFTAYHWTAILGLKDIAEVLLENGAEPNALVTDAQFRKLSGGVLMWAGDITGAQSAAVLAEESDNDDLIDFYLSQGKIDYHLRSAVMCNNKVVAKRALELGANPDMAINMAGERLITYAVKLSLQNGSEDILDVLVKNGADISKAFAISFIYGYAKKDADVWEKMIVKGAKVDQNYHDSNYNTTLLSFAYKNDDSKLDFLVKHGVDLTAQDKDGRTLLHQAVYSQSKVRLLIPPQDLCNKACMLKYLSIRDNNGDTACDIAKRELEQANKYTIENSRSIVELVCDNTIQNALMKHYSK